MFICNICNYEFKKKQSLQIHLNEKRCKSHLLDDLYLLHQYIGKLKNISCEQDFYLKTFELTNTINNTTQYESDSKQAIQT